MTTPGQERKPRRVWLKIVIGLAVLALALAGWLVIERYRAKSALARYEQQLRSKGERLSIAELVPAAVEGENSASELVRLCQSFQSGNVLILNAPPIMRFVAPGKAIVISKEADWSYRKVGRHTWDEIEPDLKLNQNTLHDLRLAVRSPVLRAELDYHTGPVIKLPHLSSGKSGAQWLAASAAFHLHAANHEAALQDIEALGELCRLYEHEPIVISQLVQMAIATMGFDRSWLALQYPVWTDAQLLRLQGLWQRREFITPMISALEMERPFCRRTLAQFRQNFDETSQGSAQEWFFSDGESGTNKVSESLRRLPFGDDIADFLQEKIPEAFHSAVVAPMWRFAWSYRDERELLEILQTIIDTTKTAQKHKAASAGRETLRQITARCDSSSGIDRWKFMFSRVFAGGLANAPGRAFRTETHRQLALTAIALHRYHLRHGKFPDTLSALVPEFLPEHPVDYMDGQKLRYRVNEETFVLWSVGEDGKDDDGTPNQTEPFSFFHGPDIVWPQPASTAEVEQYYERMKTKR